MGVRESLNQRPWITVGGSAVLIVLALVAITWEIHQGDSGSPVPARAFYSDDDGKTYFADGLDKVPPYLDSAGKTAVQAMVYQCGEATPFVGYLLRFTDQTKKGIEAGTIPRGRGGMTGGIEVKRPGNKNWLRFDPARRQPFDQITSIACPGGSADHPHILMPTRKD